MTRLELLDMMTKIIASLLLSLCLGNKAFVNADRNVTLASRPVQQREGALLEHLLRQKQLMLGTQVWQTIRPIREPNAALHVTFKLFLRQIVEVNEAQQTISIMAFEQLTFIDEFLSWDASEWGGIDEIVLNNVSKLWMPNIVSYFILKSRTVIKPPATIRSDGRVNYAPQKEYIIPCRLDLTKFPFDSHRCNTTFGTWAVDDTKMKLNISSTPTSFLSEGDYLEHPIWKDVEATAVADTQQYRTKTMTGIMYSIRFHRRTSFLALLLLLPGGFLSIITMAIFWLPPDTIIRLTLGLSAFLSFFVLMMVLTNATPQQGSIPLLGDVFAVMMTLIGLSMVCGTVTFNVSRKKGALPDTAKNMIRILGRLLCLPYTNDKNTSCPDGDAENCESSKHPDGGAETRCGGRNYVYSWMTLAILMDRAFFVIYLCMYTATGIFVSMAWNDPSV